MDAASPPAGLPNDIAAAGVKPIIFDAKVCVSTPFFWSFVTLLFGMLDTSDSLHCSAG